MQTSEERPTHSYCHMGGDEPLSGATIPEHFQQIAARFPDHEAIVCRHQGRRLTYRELAGEIDLIARGLLGLGFSKGDRIGIWATDNIEWLVVQMATARIGVIVVNINPAYRPQELAYALKSSEIKGLFLIPAFRHSNYVEMISGLVPGLAGSEQSLECKDFPHLRRVVVYDPEQPMETDRPSPGFTLWRDVVEAAEDIDPGDLIRQLALLDRDDAINIQYTSGTTGFPKAVVLSHLNLLNNAWFSAKAMGFDENDRLCVPVPFYHCFGMVLSNLLCLSVGACIVVPAEHFDPLATLQAIDKERCTGLHGVPTMFIAQLEHERFSEFDMSTLRTGIMAGAPCPEPLMKRVIEDMHCRHILIGYGQTEASPLTHLTHREDDIARRTQTVGINLPHQEVKVVSTEDGHTVSVGDVGEVCFRGYHVMKGYYNNPEATAHTIDEAGWLHSGDLGVMDENGYLRITGRLKEMIIRGGENIYPAEIEAALFAHPKIAQVAVFGVPDEYMGEEVMAWIQVHAGAALTEAEVREYAKDAMAHFKIPRYIRFVDEFPMTVTGKLQKFRMREIVLEEWARERNKERSGEGEWEGK